MKVLLSLLLMVPWVRGDSVPAYEAKIVGGAQAPAGAFPWMVALLNGADDSQTSKFENLWCGGTLIDENWVNNSVFSKEQVSSYKVIRL